jgi:molybdopterin converting factor small subunit
VNDEQPVTMTSSRQSGEAARTMTVTVRLFARYAEVLACDAVEAQVPAGSTVADVIEWLRGQYPGGQMLPRRPLCAVRLEQVASDRVLADGDELALLPPVAGG